MFISNAKVTSIISQCNKIENAELDSDRNTKVKYQNNLHWSTNEVVVLYLDIISHLCWDDNEMSPLTLSRDVFWQNIELRRSTTTVTLQGELKKQKTKNKAKSVLINQRKSFNCMLMLVFNCALMSYLSLRTLPTAEKGEASAASRDWVWRDGEKHFNHGDLLHRRPNDPPPHVSVWCDFASVVPATAEHNDENNTKKKSFSICFVIANNCLGITNCCTMIVITVILVHILRWFELILF